MNRNKRLHNLLCVKSEQNEWTLIPFDYMHTNCMYGCNYLSNIWNELAVNCWCEKKWYGDEDENLEKTFCETIEISYSVKWVFIVRDDISMDMFGFFVYNGWALRGITNWMGYQIRGRKHDFWKIVCDFTWICSCITRK